MQREDIGWCFFNVLFMFLMHASLSCCYFSFSVISVIKLMLCNYAALATFTAMVFTIP